MLGKHYIRGAETDPFRKVAKSQERQTSARLLHSVPSSTCLSLTAGSAHIASRTTLLDDVLFAVCQPPLALRATGLMAELLLSALADLESSHV